MFVQAAKLTLAGGTWRCLNATTRVVDAADRRAESGPARIFACLHRDILPALMYVAPVRPVLLVSHSGDGDILRRALGPRGFRFVRGSTGKEGGRAFRDLLRTLRDGHSVGLAVDGPRGPFGHIRSGVVQLARLSGRPIVPLTFEAPRALQLRTWDRTLVPLPFSRVLVREEGRLVVPPRLGPEQVDRWRERLARLLHAPPPGEGWTEAAFE